MENFEKIAEKLRCRYQNSSILKEQNFLHRWLRMFLCLGESLPGSCLARYFCIQYPDFDPRFTLP